ncbi:MAG: thiamine diphosphokinase [Firmicutes bacterium]|nr:thiamine diphosphokinase [Bacillota bacterium]
MNDTKKRRCVIVGGAPIIDYDNVIKYLREDDWFVFCDSGLKHLQKLQTEAEIMPDLIVGDFDSYDNPQLEDVETIVLPTVKDETDTAFAASEALRRGFDDFLIIGAIGARLDHTLVNISLLYKLYKAGCAAVLLDDYSAMTIAGKEPSYIDGSYMFFSLFNMFGPSRDITITGAKYNLSRAEVRPDAQYATSNEVAPGSTACVTVGDGELLLMKISREMSDL